MFGVGSFSFGFHVCSSSCVLVVVPCDLEPLSTQNQKYQHISVRESCLRHLVALFLVTSKCMHGMKGKPAVANRAFRNLLRNRSACQRNLNSHALEDVLRVTLLTIVRAEARFIVLPSGWSGGVGLVLWCWDGFLFC